MAVVVDLTSDERIKHPGQVVQRLVAPGLEGPASDCLTNRLQSLGTGRREKGQPVPSAPPLGSPRPERIAEKVKLANRVFTFAIDVLAVDHLRLLWMEH